MRLFYQTLGMSRGSKSGRYGQLLTEVIQTAAAPGTVIDIHGLAPHRAVAGPIQVSGVSGHRRGHRKPACAPRPKAMTPF